MSWGSQAASRCLEELCYQAAQEGIVLVAAAGNSGYGAAYPASFDDAVISVPAVDRNSNHPDFSNIYETNDLAAPGVDIISCYPGEKYKSLTGTSMAAPHVAGGVALATSLQIHNVEEKMKTTAKQLGPEEIFGAGLMQIDKVVQLTQTEQLWRKVKEIVW